MTILLLAVEFFLTGLFAVGGGLATLPFLTQMGMKYPGWFTQEMLVNMIAISESTPGPIGINMATYVGYTVGKIPGALVATLSLVLPSLIVLLLIAKMLDKYRQSPLMNTVFSGLRPVVAGLIAAAGWSVLKIVVFAGGDGAVSWINLAIFAGIFVLTQLPKIRKLHPILFIALGAALGVLLKLN